MLLILIHDLAENCAVPFKLFLLIGDELGGEEATWSATWFLWGRLALRQRLANDGPLSSIQLRRHSGVTQHIHQLVLLKERLVNARVEVLAFEPAEGRL